MPKASRLREKSTEVSSPRAEGVSLREKRGSIPCEHKLDSRRVESSTHFRGNDKTGGLVFTQSPSLREKRGSIPCEHKLDSRRVESSTHFRGNDKTGGLVFTQSASLRDRGGSMS
jgi:hemin uptake protein HemP